MTLLEIWLKSQILSKFLWLQSKTEIGKVVLLLANINNTVKMKSALVMPLSFYSECGKITMPSWLFVLYRPL